MFQLALLTQDSYKDLRHFIISDFHIANLVRLPNESFGAKIGDVKVDTVIFVFKERNSKCAPTEIVGYGGYDRIFKIDPMIAQVHGHVKITDWGRSEDCVWTLNTTEEDMTILNKCENNSLPLIECAEFSLGLTPYDKYKGHTQEQIKKKVFHADFKKNDSYKKLLAGNDVLRYMVCWNGKTWISYGHWLGAAREQKFFTEKHILVKQIIDWTTKRIWASITDEEFYNTQNAFNILPRPGWSHEYILGILNSRLMTFYHRKKFLDEFKMRFQKILIKDCKRFPIHIINSSNKSQGNQIVKLVKRMLDLNKQLLEIKIPQAKIIIQRQIKAIDQQIDKLVYKLYDLTEEEAKIIESSAGK